jgi:hypothetical protein
MEPTVSWLAARLQWTQNNCELWKRHSKRRKDGKGKGGARWSTVCLSMYSITENIYCSQLSSVAILLQPEPNCFTTYNTRKGLCSPSVLSSFGLPLPPTCLILTVSEARSYFASTILRYLLQGHKLDSLLLFKFLSNKVSGWNFVFKEYVI